MDSISAGNVVGIGGLENHVLNCGTLTSDYLNCPAFAETATAAVPILRQSDQLLGDLFPNLAEFVKNLVAKLAKSGHSVLRVAVEPQLSSDLQKVIKGVLNVRQTGLS